MLSGILKESNDFFTVAIIKIIINNYYQSN